MVKNQKGVVIVAVLWICMLLMWFAMQISSGVRLQGAVDVNHVRKSEALLLSIGGINEALARIGQTESEGLSGSQLAAGWIAAAGHVSNRRGHGRH
jgi:type II secretory pathway component PulK